MNAKKIMGAVLVALLAAALFVGAGAAAVTLDDKGTVFIYQNFTLGTGITASDVGDWVRGASTVTLVDIDGTNYYFAPGKTFADGTYEKNGKKVTVTYPTAIVSGTAGDASGQYMIMGGTYYTGDDLAITSPNSLVNDILVFFPNNTAVNIPKTDLSSATAKTIFDKTGDYKFQAIFVGTGNFAPGTPADLLQSKAIYNMKVAKGDSVKISAASTSVTQGDNIPVTFEAKPGMLINLSIEKVTIQSYGTVSTPNPGDKNITIPNNGKAVIYINANKNGEGKIIAKPLKNPTTWGEEKEFIINIAKGELSAKTEKESYYIGDEVKITGKTTVGDSLWVYVKGTNKEIQVLNETGETTNDVNVENNEFTYKVAGKTFQYFDAGTYTVYVSDLDVADFNLITSIKDREDAVKKSTYAAASLVLKQPFIGDLKAPTVAVKTSTYKVTGTAEATDNVLAYIFGTNFFVAFDKDTIQVGDPALIVALDPSITVKDGKFNLSVDIPSSGMDAGQYFLVVQHPMYNKTFDIKPTNGGIVDNNGVVIISVTERQKPNAAQALCEAIETQNIDDMYAKTSFVVASPTSTINPIQTEITKGSKLIISGTTNLGKEEVVTVEMLSTAFAAVPKETVGSAAFVSVTTKTDKDGNWEVEFDTSRLNVDEYTVSVAVADLDKTTAKINVIEGAPVKPTETVVPTETQQPTQPTQTQQPTTPPKTPGFGALAALAGLGAVAVLLLRRE